MGTVEVTDDDFRDRVLHAEKPVVVDFWAPWCGPCKMVAPVLEALADQYKEKITIAKIDVDQNGDTAVRYDVRAIPTIIVFSGGEPVKRIVGARPRPELLTELGEFL